MKEDMMKPGLTGLCGRRRALVFALVLVALAAPSGSICLGQVAPSTATPVTKVVVIFQENVSFDHYFGTYPQAANTYDSLGEAYLTHGDK